MRYIVLEKKVSRYDVESRPQGYRMMLREVTAPVNPVMPGNVDFGDLMLGTAGSATLEYTPVNAGTLTVTTPDWVTISGAQEFAVAAGVRVSITFNTLLSAVEGYTGTIKFSDPIFVSGIGTITELSVTANGVNNALDIFVYQLRGVDYNFETIASPVDLEEYPVIAAAEDTDTFRRDSQVDLYARNPELLEEVWRSMLTDIDELLRTMRVLDNAPGNTATYTIIGG